MATRQPRGPKELAEELDRLLSAPDDQVVVEGLEHLGAEPAFPHLASTWAPKLYDRNKVKFRPFILSHLNAWGWDGKHYKQVKWSDALDGLLSRADANDDIELFKRLYPWKHTKGWRLDEARWRSDLLAMARDAKTPATRRTVFDKMSLWAQIDEPTAVALYEIDPAAATLIKNTLPRFFAFTGREKRKPWASLWKLAKDQKDEDFYWWLYRAQVPIDQWEKDILVLAASGMASDELDDALQRHHPSGFSIDLGSTFVKLLQTEPNAKRYVMRHLREVYAFRWGERRAYKQMLDLSVKRQWLDLWGALSRTCASEKEYNETVASVLDNGALSDAQTVERLSILSGVSREYNFGPWGLALVKFLSDDNAVRLYTSYPGLLRGPFKAQISPSYHTWYPRLLDLAIEREDDDLVDYLASRIATHWIGSRPTGKSQRDEVDTLVDYYSALENDRATFARRAAHVLGLVPAYTIWDYRGLIRSNKLARLFYQRSASFYLEDETVVRDLLEASEIHAQALAFRALGLPSDRAKALARSNLDLLLATLLRPLHRKTRALAFAAIENGAIDLESATRILEKAREAVDLPDKKYPKESLIGLIGRLLHRYADARSEAEQPVIYRRASA